MVINYKRTQKTILRVNPRLPLAEFLPAICEKCEFNTETTVLLRDVQSLTPLDLSSSLNDYAIREVYAKDTKGKFEYIQILPSTSASESEPEPHTCWFCRSACISRAPSLTNMCRYFTAQTGCFVSVKFLSTIHLLFFRSGDPRKK